MTTDQKLDTIWAISREQRTELQEIRSMLAQTLGISRAMQKLHADLLTKRPTLKEQAKKLGVHPSTLSRRLKQEELRRMVGITP